METAAIAPLWVLSVGYGLLVFLKATGHEQACEKRGARTRPILRFSAKTRAGLASLAACLGAALQVSGELYAGAALLTATVLLSSFRLPVVAVRARGPGEWCKLHDDALLTKDEPADPFDPVCTAAVPALLALAGTVLVLAFLGQLLADAGLLVLADSLIVLPLLLTGHDRDLPPDTRTASVPWLSALRTRLLHRGLAVSLMGRRPLGRANVDEMRLVVQGPRAMVGAKSIEVGVAFGARVGSLFPEVLVRVVFGSPASQKLLASGRLGRAIPGRSADERVFTVPVRSRTEEATCELVEFALSELAERRVVVSEFPEGDRRERSEESSPLLAELTA